MAKKKIVPPALPAAEVQQKIAALDDLVQTIAGKAVKPKPKPKEPSAVKKPVTLPRKISKHD